MATFAYIRVSTDKQDLDNQRHGVIEYAKKNKLEPLTFFEDTASGKKSWKDRDLGKLLEQASAGDVLLVAEISRLARSTLQVLEILQEAAQKRNRRACGEIQHGDGRLAEFQNHRRGAGPGRRNRTRVYQRPNHRSLSETKSRRLAAGQTERQRQCRKETG